MSYSSDFLGQNLILCTRFSLEKSQQELQQSRPDTRASNSRAEIRQRHMEQKRAGQADAQYVMAQLGRAAPMSYRPSQQNVEKPPWEIRRQSKGLL